MDWLTLARDANFDDEHELRHVLAMTRRYGAQHVIDLLGAALREYRQTHDTWPRTVAELAAYFPTPVDPAILDRYQMMISGKIDPRLGPAVEAIAQNAWVDKAYDWRLVVLPAGETAITWMREAPLLEATQKARLEYARTHEGRVSLVATDYLPYVESPVIKEVIQAKYDWTQATAGREDSSFTDPSVLLPYLRTPEARALAEEFWPNRPRRSRTVVGFCHRVVS